MSIYCGWASIDERGRASGGAAGDQTGLEVKVGRWYYFRQNCVLRFKDRAKAKKAAQICRGIANNNKVGYDQGQRTTLYQELARVGWDPARITKPVETDCSAMVAAIVNAVGIKVSKDLWTGNMKSALYGTGAFYLYTDSAYTESDRLLMTGDIILNEASHVIMALEDGPGETGWVKKGKDWYYYEKGVPVKNAWRMDSKGWCYLGNDGKMKTNAWAQDSKDWCYVGPDGRMVTNKWQKDSTGWCYLGKDGHILRDTWLSDGGHSYFLKKDGHMATGNVNIVETFDQQGKWRGGRQA